MRITLIAAVGEGNGVIGNDAGLPWTLPADLARFRRKTLGKPILMGRKTRDTLPHALPGRRNIVLTRQANYAAAGTLVAHSLDEALHLAEEAPELMIIGGAELYALFLPQADALYLPEVAGDFAGTAFFPPWNPASWELQHEEAHPADARNPHAHTYREYRRAAQRA